MQNFPNEIPHLAPCVVKEDILVLKIKNAPSYVKVYPKIQKYVLCLAVDMLSKMVYHNTCSINDNRADILLAKGQVPDQVLAGGD